MGNLTYKYLGTAKHARQTKRSRLWQDAQPTDCLALAAISLFAQRALRGVPDDYQWPGDSKTRKQVRLGCPAAWWQVCKSGQHLRQRVGSPRKQQSLVPSKNPETRGKLKWSFSRQQESTDNHGNRWKRKTSNRQPGYRQFICKKSAIFPLCWSMFRLPFVGLNFAKVFFPKPHSKTNLKRNAQASNLVSESLLSCSYAASHSRLLTSGFLQLSTNTLSCGLFVSTHTLHAIFVSSCWVPDCLAFCETFQQFCFLLGEGSSKICFPGMKDKCVLVHRSAARVEKRRSSGR